ncbi:MAG: orotidine-5'-phosphate decarboxylase [Clostridiales bacterium]|nr:orotidine-5'-phosphate decarboxylase [Clostridiales bacterium]
MRNFADELVRKIAELDNPTVIGLDPKLDYIPDAIKEYSEQLFPEEPEKATAKAIWIFNKEIIDKTYDIVPAIKLQFAYYEMYGVEALKTMCLTARYAQKMGMLVIGDCKRNDIGSTATAYAEAVMGKTELLLNEFKQICGFDACTVNAYLGIDGVQPFIDVAKRDGKGIFCLVRTSNPSAGDFQDLKLEDGRLLYEAVAAKVDEWGKDMIGEEGFSSIGAVVGATWPEQAVAIRKIMPNTFILVPGYGAQGAGADAAVAGFTADGKGAIVNNSRAIMTAWKKQPDIDPWEFGEASRAEALDMKEKLNAALKDRKYV